MNGALIGNRLPYNLADDSSSSGRRAARRITKRRERVTWRAEAAAEAAEARA